MSKRTKDMTRGEVERLDATYMGQQAFREGDSVHDCPFCVYKHTSKFSEWSAAWLAMYNQRGDDNYVH